MKRLDSAAALAALLLAALLGAACEGAPTAPAPAAPGAPAFSGATVTREDWGPESFSISPPAPCLGQGAVLAITGTISGWDRFVERPDGSLHVTEYFPMTDLVATFGGRTWTAAPGSHEIWSVNFPPGVVDLSFATQLTHAGNTVFRASDGGPDLRFVHQIHLVRLPSGELQIFRVIFEVQCIGFQD